MIVSDTPIPGVLTIDIQKHEDHRGFFARIFCANEFKAHGLPTRMLQNSIAFNNLKGTLRGLHYHRAPSTQSRLVLCISGSMFIVVVDLRPDSPTYLHHYSTLISTDNYRSIFISPGIALGYQTLIDNSVIHYQMSDFYDPNVESGFRWNDRAFNINWPEDNRTILERDNNYPDFDPRDIVGFQGYYSHCLKEKECGA